MLPTQIEFEAMLNQLREHQTETALIDGKADLPLETTGDRAFFIRHTAALANNVEPSFLIIGLEDRTWVPIGLPNASPLLNPDQTQQRMNQILSNRIDPNLAIRYRTYQVGGLTLGVVAIQGDRAPYIIGINDLSYGGDRTRGEPENIYRGMVYIRRGSNSIIANRQSDLISIIEKVNSLAITSDETDNFLVRSNYLEVDTEEFAKHTLSNRLLEPHLSSQVPWVDGFIAAKSWVSFVFVPTEGNCQLDTAALKNKLKSDQSISGYGEWFHAIPYPLYHMLLNPRATPRDLIGEVDIRNRQTGEQITHFLRILPSGHIEYGGTYPMFFEREEYRCFSFVSIIGPLWQLTYFSKAIFTDAGYNGEVQVLLNLRGTNNTRLADFAGDPHHGGWLSPFDPGYFQQKDDYYHGINIQIDRKIDILQSTDEQIETMIRDIATELGAYYGQDQPRCFHPSSGEFPIRDYLQKNVNP